MSKPSFIIPCPHERNRSVSHKETLADYHRLTLAEIIKLLNHAKAHKNDARVVAQVQVRLMQAVIGCTCPRSTEGANARITNELCQIFVDRYKTADSEKLAKELASLMG